VIQRFRPRHPDANPEDVSRALRLALGEPSGRKETAQVALVIGLAVLIALGGLLAWALQAPQWRVRRRRA
jgi:hypothetical protein